MFDLQVCCCRSFLWLLLLDTGKSLFSSQIALLQRFTMHRHIMSSLHEAATRSYYS